jgi:FlaA1/EpsC-like NDP-sugar epimerase
MKLHRYILVVLDVFLVVLSFYLAHLLRFEWLIPPENLEKLVTLIPVIAGISAVTFVIVDLYNRLWEYASIQELVDIVKAVSISVGALVISVYFLDLVRLPRSTYIIAWLLGIFFIGSSRLWWRMVREYLMSRTSQSRVCVVGVSEDGVLAARLAKNEVVGFVDDDLRSQKTSIMGIPVLGTPSEIRQLINAYSIDEVVVAKTMKGQELRNLIQTCKESKVVVKLIKQGNGGMVPKLRPVDLEDLLGRPSVALDIESIAGYLTDRTVMVTGAGGSIGSELCRQIGRYKPRKLVALDNSENSLFELELGLRTLLPDLSLEVVLLDVKDHDRLHDCLQTHRPEVVFHAAAYKHVPMMERFPHQAWANNVVGTRNLIDCAQKSGVETFILISTDKAVDPANAMGASKRLCELLVMQANSVGTGAYSAVRFGNVLGSRGSVIPIFQQQIDNGGPVTVTDPNMTRFFMTIPEAVQLVIQAGAMAKGGEIFVLDMGDPVNILELAEDLVRLSGLTPGKDIEIKITGSRPGEKIEEELFTKDEQLDTTSHGRIFIARNSNFNRFEMERICKEFFSECMDNPVIELKARGDLVT